MNFRTYFCFILFTLFISGCSNIYKENFVPTTSLAWHQPITPMPRQTSLKLIKINNKIDLVTWLEKGYFLLGYSHFYDYAENDSSAQSFAEELNAELLILSRQYVGEIQRMETVFTDELCGFSHVHTRRGRYAFVPHYHTRAQTIPQTYNLFNTYAFYLCKGTSDRVGLFLREMNSAEKQKVETNRGAVVIATLKSSPAYHAELLPNDIILKCNDRQFSSLQELVEQLTQSGEYHLQIRRNDKNLLQTIRIP